MHEDYDIAGVHLTLASVVGIELESGKGEEELFRLIEAEQLVKSPNDPIPTVFSDDEYLSNVIQSVADELTDCWQSFEFLEVVQKNPSALLINIETGDFPELINATYPWSESLEFNYSALTDLEGRTRVSTG